MHSIGSQIKSLIKYMFTATGEGKNRKFPAEILALLTFSLIDDDIDIDILWNQQPSTCIKLTGETISHSVFESHNINILINHWEIIML